MLDKRCRHKVRELQSFYLFRKHGYYFYAFYPEYNVTRSTGKLNIQEAYIEAWDIMGTISEKQNVKLYLPFKDKKRQRDLKRALSFIDQNKPLTSKMIHTALEKMLSEGMSGKTANNYIYALRKSYTGVFPTWKPVEHVATYRSCFPITAFYGFWKKCNCRLHYLAFFTMTTGCRLSEIITCENIGNGYLKINGTKTKNAVRTIPVLPETLACLEHLKVGFRSAAYKESVYEAGRLCGFEKDYIDENNIVFHNFRKMYKTLLESCNIPETFINYYMGHSQTSSVQQLYFIGSSADDSEVYPKVIEALRRFL